MLRKQLLLLEEGLEITDPDFIVSDDLGQQIEDVAAGEKGHTRGSVKVVTGDETWVIHFEPLFK